jgi:FAD/FMN-containing dehydrogenase
VIHPASIKDRIKIQRHTVEKYFLPPSINHLKTYIASNQGPISIIGKGYSEGGQTITETGTVIDLSKLNEIVAFDKKLKTITIQAGATWKQVQEFIDQKDLSLEGIQSYNDFSVGGSIGVNCHGRDISGSLENSILSITVLTADGSLITASRNQNKELFQACVGGYGLLGIIVDVTLQLKQNCLLTKEMNMMPLTSYPDYFKQEIRNNPDAQIHSAIVWFDKNIKVSATTFFENHPLNKDAQKSRRLRKHKKQYLIKTGIETLYRRLKMIQSIEPQLEAKRARHEAKKKNKYYFRNYEMSQTVNSLEPITRFFSTSFLQEYFIPCEKIVDFIALLKSIKTMYGINLVNATIRFVPAQKQSVLSYALTDCFACVLYINIWNNNSEIKNAQVWTQYIIEAALACGGTFYLPYQLYATQEQFNKAYPMMHEFLKIKKQFDPQNIFQNKLYQKYMNPQTSSADFKERCSS